MLGEPKVIEALNQVLAVKLVTISQSFLHGKMLKNWGLTRLANIEYGYSIQAMKHTDILIERILFLGGCPAADDIGYLRIGENAEEMLESDLSLIENIAAAVGQASKTSERYSDYVSRDILIHILKALESQIDWLESQRSLISDIGLPNYLQSQID